MERLLFALMKLVLRLLFVLLKFVVRLALFAYTGDWHKLDKLIARARELMDELRSEQGKPASKQRPRAIKPRAAQRPATQRVEQPWLFAYPDELTESESTEELRGGESVIQTTFSRRPVPRRTVASAAPHSRARKDLPLALAIRDPRMVRDAMVLTAALGRSRGGARGRG